MEAFKKKGRFMNILSIEASTTSAKAMFYSTEDKKNDVVSKAFTGLKDASMQDADQIYSQTMALARTLSSGKKIDVISLSGTWFSILALDKNMIPLTPAILWNCTIASSICEKLRHDDAYVNDFYSRTGCMVNAIYPTFKLKWLFKEDPSLKNARFASLGSYFNYRLTGHMTSSKCLESGSGLLNLKTGEYDSEVLKDIGISAGQLSELNEYDKILPLSSDAASLLDVTAGIPVVTTSADGGLNQVGSGALSQGIATLSLGTSGAVRLSSSKPMLSPSRGVWCYRSPKAYLVGAATNGCCNCMDWARSSLFSTATSFSDIENQLQFLEDTPVFLPFLYGERCPGWDDTRLGGFYALKPSHDKLSMYEAVQEGCVFNLLQCFNILKDLTGDCKTIRMSGGVLSSPFWSQMCANIFNRDIMTDDFQHASLMGAAVMAMDIFGLMKAEDFNPQFKAIIRPDPDKAAIYAKKYKQYLDAYLG